MATYNANRVIIENMTAYNFVWIIFILARSKDNYSISDEFEY